MRLLLEPSHDVITTTRGSEALAMVSAGQRFDVVVCDLQMPEVTGKDVYERLRELLPELAERLVFISGGAYTQAARDFIRVVRNRVLDKPVRPDVLWPPSPRRCLRSPRCPEPGSDAQPLAGLGPSKAHHSGHQEEAHGAADDGGDAGTGPAARPPCRCQWPPP